jgi:hypothetical protein
LGKQYGMPSRHISPQSFDDILSELGDDPAIPDPHGIRKSSPPPRSASTNSVHASQTPSFVNKLNLGQFKIGLHLALGGACLLSSGALFFALEAHKEEAKHQIHALQEQAKVLQNSLSLIQEDWDQNHDELYKTIDELEVSIHSLNEKSANIPLQRKPITTPFESELRQWRYLGLIGVNGAEQGFFHTGKSTVMLAINDLALGEWRMTQVQNGLAILSHPKGGTINFKPIKKL